MTYKFWQHQTTGEIYAVSMTDDGSDLTGVVGPLHYSDRTSPLDDFEYGTEDLDWLIENSGFFRDVTTPTEHANRARYAFSNRFYDDPATDR
jgi:hypothetical protein